MSDFSLTVWRLGSGATRERQQFIFSRAKTSTSESDQSEIEMVILEKAHANRRFKTDGVEGDPEINPK